MQRLPEFIDHYVQSLEADAEQRAVISGLIQYAVNSYPVQKDDFIAAFDTMTNEAKAGYEQIALANGLDELLLRLDDIEAKLAVIDAHKRAITFNQADSQTFIDIVCTAREIADVSAAIADINASVADILDGLSYVDWLPVVGQVVKVLQGISSAVGMITDIVGLVAEFIPELDDLQVLVNPGALLVGQSAQLSATITAKVISGLCDNASGAIIDDLMERIQNMLNRGLARMSSTLNGAFRRAGWERDDMSWAVGLCYDAINAVSETVLDALGVRDRLEDMADDLCEFLGQGDPLLTVLPNYEIGCGGSNTQVNCTADCIGNISVAASIEVCDEAQSIEFAVPCSCESTCSTPNARRCDGLEIEVCKEVGGGCYQWQALASCVSPDTCEDGLCVGGNSPCAISCAGCCSSGGDCTEIAAQNDNNCGHGGALCAVCTGGATCEAGSCSSPECSCASGATFEVVSGCDGWEDATECTGFHSVYCYREGHDWENDPLCQMTPESEAEFEQALFDSGTLFDAYDCSIRVQCI